jgi:hypothetical protein
MPDQSVSAQPDPPLDPAPRSWVAVPSDSGFPIQNLPSGVLSRHPVANAGLAAAAGVARSLRSVRVGR